MSVARGMAKGDAEVISLRLSGKMGADAVGKAVAVASGHTSAQACRGTSKDPDSSTGYEVLAKAFDEILQKS